MRILLAVACLAIASAAVGETIYKYQDKDGRTLYSNRPISGAKLIEAYEHEATTPPPHRYPTEREAKVDERIRQSLDALDQAWKEVQVSGKALAEAEARVAAGADAQGGESRGVAESGAPPAVGGPAPAVPAAVGGRMSPGRGRAQSPEYLARVESLQAAVKAARERNEAAWRAYNQLR